MLVGKRRTSLLISVLGGPTGPPFFSHPFSVISLPFNQASLDLLSSRKPCSIICLVSSYYVFFLCSFLVWSNIQNIKYIILTIFRCAIQLSVFFFGVMFYALSNYSQNVKSKVWRRQRVDQPDLHIYIINLINID